MDIKDRVYKVFSLVFNVDENDLKMTDSKETIQSWDSIGHLSLVMRLEEEFRIRLTTEQVIEIDSIEKAVEYLETLILKD